jgi:hypothetical protein
MEDRVSGGIAILRALSRPRFAFAALAAVSLGLAPSTAPAQPAPAAAAPGPELMAKAMELARTVQPREILIENTMSVLDKQAVEGLHSEPNLKQMEAEHPGLVDAMWAAARPILAETVVKSIPELWNGLAGVYARHFTSAQLDQAIQFFRSPTGRKFVVEMNRNADIKPMIRDAAGPGDGRIGEQSYLQTVNGAAQAAAAAMTPAETREFERFMTTPTGRALAGAGPDVTRVILAWTNRTDPETDARVQAAMVGAVEKFLGAREESLNGPPSTRGGE